MSRRQKSPLRNLETKEEEYLRQISRSNNAKAVVVIRAKLILAVSEGHSYESAAKSVGRKSGDAVAHLVKRFNDEGINALLPRHGGGQPRLYTEKDREKIIEKFRQQPDRKKDGTATWSITTLRNALRKENKKFANICGETVWQIITDAGYTWQKDRTWKETGVVKRKRKSGVVELKIQIKTQKKLIEKAYKLGEEMGFAIWCEDEAGPYPTTPYLSSSWQLEGLPKRLPSEYIKNGTAKMITLLHPKSGEVRVKGVKDTTNKTLHSWLKQELEDILSHLPVQENKMSKEENKKIWQQWQEGLSIKITLPDDLPPLRMLLIFDNLQGHYTCEFVLWLFEHGIMPLYTPLGGAWLNMAESIQRIIKRRALDGQNPQTPEEIMLWLEEVAEAWNENPTPFVWDGKRAERRRRQREKSLYKLGGSCACTLKPIKNKFQNTYKQNK